MAVMGASFQIGRSALAAYQAALTIVGQNVANVGNPDYTRQTGRLTPLIGGAGMGGWSPGAGVRLTAIQRHVDEAVESRLRDALATMKGSATAHAALSQIESLYNELSDQDVSSNLNGLFASFSALQGAPEQITNRNLVVSAADTLIQNLQRQRRGLLDLVEDLNGSAEAAARRAGEIADEVAHLNGEIVLAESQTANGSAPLRDRRDALLRELSELLQIEISEQASGAVNVYVGSEPLVEYTRSRGLTVQREQIDGLEIASVRFADNLGPVTLRDGELAGLALTRDQQVVAQLRRLDQLAKGVIYEVNRVHAEGRGLIGYSSAVGTYAVDDVNAALNSTAAGLPFPVKNGTFLVNIRDTRSGQVVTRQIEVDLDGLGAGDTSLSSLTAALDALPNLAASMTPDGRLSLQADGGYEFWFSEDDTGAMAALGVATFFKGQDASDIAVNDPVRSDVRLIAASLSGELGDGENAGAIAALTEQLSELLDNQSPSDFHSATIHGLAVEAASARTNAEAAESVHAALLAQREAISGVSLDEEAINLAKFEKAYQASTRFINVLESLSDELLGLLG
ncbi:MAG: Flagellar hook-associated protein 1 [Phycisphaerae bacterium]|nr:Flagellar hook-associated protein 1 [Phycisphaerae bacterium]